MYSNKPKPQVLAITSQLPWPLNSGGHLRTFYMLRALQQRFRVTLVAPCLTEHKSTIKVLQDHDLEVLPAWVPARAIWRESFRALNAAVGGSPYVMYARHDHRAVRKLLRREIATRQPDLVYLDHLDAAVYSEELPHVPVVADFHNIYSKLARRTAEEQSGILSRYYLTREAALLERAESNAARMVDLVFAVSDLERDFFMGLGAPEVSCVPNGVDCAAYASLPVGRGGAPPTILYVGPMSYGPNAAAAEYLATSIMPAVRAKFPDARLRIVGRDPTPALVRLNDLPSVEVLGAVPDMLPELLAAQILAVPLESAGGTRLKILEAFAAGLPVISTPVGAEGLQVANGRELRIAKREHFVERIVELLNQPNEGKRLAAAARELVCRRFDWSFVGDIATAAVWSLWQSRCGGQWRKSHGNESAA